MKWAVVKVTETVTKTFLVRNASSQITEAFMEARAKEAFEASKAPGIAGAPKRSEELLDEETKLTTYVRETNIQERDD